MFSLGSLEDVLKSSASRNPAIPSGLKGLLTRFNLDSLEMALKLFVVPRRLFIPALQ
jgi:hypothetical protein